VTSGLTAHQIELLQALADGQTALSVANSRGRSIKTIEKTIARARRHLRARTATQAVAAALRRELID